MKIKDRIKQLYTALGMSSRAFSEQIGKSPMFARTIGATIGVDVVNNIKREFPQVNIDWLITGEGNMFEAELLEVTPRATSAYFINKYSYNKYFQAFNDNAISNLDFPSIFVSNTIDINGYYVVFEHRGDSMDNNTSLAILDGDMLVCKAISSIKEIVLQKSYLIVLNNGEILTRIITQWSDNKATLKPLNKIYPDLYILLNEINHMFYIEQIIRIL